MISVSTYFELFCKNLRLSDDKISAIRARYHLITKRINLEYWNTTSDSTHSLYVGSYGRGTCINTSDVDIVVELPWSLYFQYDAYTWNGQSSLLQNVKDSLKKTYSTSSVNADGQVIDIDFNDGIKFEVVPAFRHSDDSYRYPDTNNGGSWKDMAPKAEISAFNAMNKNTNGNLKELCKMVRAWNRKNYVCMSGILIDTLAYRFINGYEYAEKSYTYYDWISRDFFKFLYEESDKDYWLKPGSNERVYKKYSFWREAKESYEKCLKAIEYGNKDMAYSWCNTWRDIYGTEFPSA